MNRPLKFVNHRIEEYALRVTYDPSEDAGNIIYNLSLIHSEDLEYAIGAIKKSYGTGLCVSNRIKILDSKEEIQDFVIPDGCIGVCTPCSITIDAVLLRRGVPVNFIGGGVVEIRDQHPQRFTTMIRYEHTTIDPLEVLISQKITSVIKVMEEGNGSILANIRECHMEAESIAGEVIDSMISAGFSGILDIGAPNVPLLGVPATQGYMGIAIIGGTNPLAILRESGRWVEPHSLKGLIPAEKMDYIAEI